MVLEIRFENTWRLRILTIDRIHFFSVMEKDTNLGHQHMPLSIFNLCETEMPRKFKILKLF